jgi:hypothetical protein
MTVYSFVPPFREAEYCGEPSCVFDKLGCAAGEKRLRNTELDRDRFLPSPFQFTMHYHNIIRRYIVCVTDSVVK